MWQRYGLELLDFPKCYNGCGTTFTIKHALAFKKEGLVFDGHNEVKAETGGGVIQDLGSNWIHNKPKIITCHDALDSQMPRLVHTHSPPDQFQNPPLHKILHSTTFQPQPRVIIWSGRPVDCRTLRKANVMRHWHESNWLGSSNVSMIDPGAGICFSRKDMRKFVLSRGDNSLTT